MWNSLRQFVTIAAVSCRPGTYTFVTTDAEFVARFVIKLKMLWWTIMAVIAFKFHPMKSVIEVDITIVGRKIHRMSVSRGHGGNNKSCQQKMLHLTAPDDPVRTFGCRGIRSAQWIVEHN